MKNSFATLKIKIKNFIKKLKIKKYIIEDLKFKKDNIIIIEYNKIR